ncbi:hypothetical protein F4825DRAFT_452767 [Nemania diffusa]|nr:hypothetical protein F4825DRAFT_452767 [Nemania diffusa]
MSEQNKPIAQASPASAATWVFKPVKDNPAEAAKFVRCIFKHKPDNVDLVAAELAPLFGFGPNSNQNVLARWLAQSVFTTPEITYPLKEFLSEYTGDKWGLPVADWTATMALVHEHRRDQYWTGPVHRPFPNDSIPEFHYARFLIFMLSQLEIPVGRKTQMMQWLRDAAADNREDDVCWVFFYALMYFQLKAMDLNKARAPFKDVAKYHVQKLVDKNSFFSIIFKLMSSRRGYSEVSPESNSQNLAQSH